MCRRAWRSAPADAARRRPRTFALANSPSNVVDAVHWLSGTDVTGKTQWVNDAGIQHYAKAYIGDGTGRTTPY